VYVIKIVFKNPEIEQEWISNKFYINFYLKESVRMG